jgi:thioredoxin reductase (NADPH)
MSDRAMNHDKIEFRWNANVIEANGNDDTQLLQSIVLDTGETIQCSGLFFGIGHEPATSFLKNQIDLDENGYIIVDQGRTSTNVDGVYACGDVMDHEWRQAITAAGTGCMAALEAERWLSS